MSEGGAIRNAVIAALGLFDDFDPSVAVVKVDEYKNRPLKGTLWIGSGWLNMDAYNNHPNEPNVVIKGMK